MNQLNHARAARQISRIQLFKTFAITFALSAMLVMSALQPDKVFAAGEDDSSAQVLPRVNLNTAESDALQYIPGIGPGKAAEIIRVREESGGFKSLDDLLTVPGIGARVLFEIKKYGALKGGVSKLSEEMQANPPSMTVLWNEGKNDGVVSQDESGH